MHTLNDVERLANELLARTFTFNARGRTYSLSAKNDLGYRFKWDNAKRRFGQCHYGRLHISLSKTLCQVNLDKIHGKITDTILHEIAHALCVEVYGRLDGRGHGANWKSIAKQIGCDGKRCYDSSKVTTAPKKYTLTCPTCDRVTHRHRMSKGLACGVCCKGVYNEKHMFIVKINH